MKSTVKMKIYDYIQPFYRPAYAVGYRFNDEQTGSFNKEIPFNLILPNKDEWYADPFPWIYNNKHYIFAEVMNHKEKKGYIGVTCLEYDDNKFHAVLKENFHLSFPNVFEFNGHIYMIPETSACKQLRIYEAVKFPDEWALKKVLLDNVSLVDTAVFITDNKIYLESFDKNKQCNVFFSLDIEAFSLKKCNFKSKTYIDKRPGGTAIITNEKVSHALQNCDNSYGEYLHLADIDIIDDDNFAEYESETVKVKDVKTNRKLKFKRIHTLNKAGNFEVIDLYLYQLFKSIPL